ncbi:MAG: phage tail tape measure protein [Phascolarctobacterium sp.]|nr:phage tail tape measure protein [Candidatus Phascolarctobacterium caballi]
MAGSQKEFELLFKLKASLGGDFNSTFKSAINTNNQLRDSLKNVNSLQSKIDGYTKQSAAIDKNKERLAQLNAEHDRLQQELQQTSEPTEALRRKLEKNETQIQQTTAKIKEQEQQLDTYGQELREAGINTDNLEEANGRLQRSYDKLKTSQQTLQQINEKQQQVNASISQTKGQLLGTIGTISAVAAAVYAGPVQSAQEYETAMAKVATIADTSAVPLEAMSQQIVALSNQTGISANAIADDVYNAISAGQNTADAVNFVTNSTKLAKAGFAESSQTLDVLTTILNAYGMSADKVGAVSDMLIQTQNKGKVTVGELSSVMGKVIPTANSNGVALEQLTASYAIMTSKGIAAAETTTYLNSMMNELGKSGTKTDKLLRSATGSSFKELMASGKSLGDVLQIVQDEAAKSGLSMADMFGSAEAGKAAVTLLSNGVDGFNSSVQDMVNSVGATNTAFETMDKTTEAKMQKAKNSISNLSIVLGQNLLPIVGNLADKVATLVTKVSEFAQENPKAVQTVMKMVAGFAGLKVASLGTKLGFLEAKKGVLGIMAAFEKFKALKAAESLGGIATKAGGIAVKLGPIVAVAAAIGAAIYYVANNLEDVRANIQQTFGDEGLKIFDEVWASITMVGDAFKTAFAGVSTDVFSTLQQILPTIISTLKTAATSILPVLVQLVTQLAPLLAQFISAILPVLGQLITAIIQIAGNLITAVLPIIIELIAQLIPVITQIISAILPVIIELLNTLVPIVMQIISAILPVIIELLNTLLPVIMQIIQAVLPIIIELLNQLMPIIQMIVSAILPMLVQVINALLPLFQTIISAILPVLTTLINALVPVIQVLASVLSSVLGGALTTITNIVQSVMTVFQGLIDFITGVFTGNWSQAWNGIKEIFSGAVSGLGEIIKAPLRAVVSAVNGVISGLNQLKVPDWVPGIGGKGINIPLIPGFAKGTLSTPDTFIAGENGPELITNAPGRTVFTADQTRNIMAAQNMAATAPTVAAGQATAAQTVNTTAPEVTPGAGSGNGGTNNFTINNNPTIVIEGDKPEDLDAKLEENNQRLLREMEDLMDQKKDKEERQRYD